MKIEVKPLEFPDVLYIRTKRLIDARGFFTETYSRRDFADAGIECSFVQDNHSYSASKGTVRGLHFQSAPHAQAKLVRVVRGSVLDVVVDIRRSSSTFGRWISLKLSSEDGEQIFVPAGYAHGFCTLENDTEVAYKVSAFYTPEHDHGIRWNDPALAIDWPVTEESAILSEKDRNLPLLKDSRHLA